MPSPRILSGEDASSGEDEDDESSDEEPVYVPKATKSRGSAQRKQVKRQETVRKAPAAVKKAGPTKKTLKKQPVGKARGKPTKVVKKGKLPRVEDSEEEEEQEEIDVEPEYTPRKSQSRGGPARISSPKKPSPKSKKLNKSEKHGRPQQRAPSPSEDDIDDEQPENTPWKSQSRGKSYSKVEKELKISPKKTKSKSSKASPASTAEKKVQRIPAKGGGSITKLKAIFNEESDGEDADSEAEYTPRKSTSRGGPLSPSKTKRKK